MLTVRRKLRTEREFEDDAPSFWTFSEIYNKAHFWAFCTREFLQPISSLKRGRVAFSFFPSPGLPSLSPPPPPHRRATCLNRLTPGPSATTPTSTRSTTTPASQRQLPPTTRLLNASAAVPLAARTKRLLPQRLLQPPQAPLQSLPAGREAGPQRGSQKKRRSPKVGSPPSPRQSARGGVPARTPSRSRPGATRVSPALQVLMHPPRRKSAAALRRMPVERRPPPPSQSSIVLLTHALPNPPRIPPIPSPLCAVYLLPTLMTLHDLAYEPSSPLYSPRYAPLLVGLYATILRYCSRLSPMLSHPASVKPIRSFQCDEQGDFASPPVGPPGRLANWPRTVGALYRGKGELCSRLPASVRAAPALRQTTCGT